MPSAKRQPKGLFVGLATVDLVYAVSAVPKANEKLSVAGQQVCAGGPATNAGVTFACLGGRAELVTAVGAHSLATVIHDDLARHSVRLHDIARGRHELPPISSIMVSRATGERTVVSANATVFSRVRARFHPEWLRRTNIL